MGGGPACGVHVVLDTIDEQVEAGFGLVGRRGPAPVTDQVDRENLVTRLE
jgi:hypothetical protein